MRRISRWELITNIDSALPGGYAVTEAGELWRATGDGNIWEQVFVGGTPVIVRRAELGPMMIDGRRQRPTRSGG